jgi:murein DD-endopeptidase MepM/ murein hydrolase activator NlpD
MPPAFPSARLPRIRRSLLSAALFSAFVASSPASATFAEAGSQQAQVDLVHVQRPISEDFMIDQALVAAVEPVARPLPRFNAIWPTRGQITTYFGEVGPLSPRGHSGLDVAGPMGTPILAMDDGEVLKAYWNADGYGGLVIVGHPSGYETWYGHLARFTVDKGDQVTRGQQIGLMGSTGFSTGPHLHFEVRQDGQLRDPLDFLSEANLQRAD